jgi:hypothetical protein
VAGDGIEMRQAFRCIRCHGVVGVQGSLCLGCWRLLGWEASERWVSEWWKAQLAPEHLRAQQRQHRRDRPRVITEPLLYGPLVVVLFFASVASVASGNSPDPTDLFLAAWCLLTVVCALVLYAIGTVSDPDDDTERTDL